MKIIESDFGKVPSGESAKLITIENDNGYSCSVTNLGATLVSFNMPDKKGEVKNITLGFDSAGEYFEKRYYLGCTVGRFANRIAKGKFSLDGEEYTLAQNDGENHLHGGAVGFDQKIWDYEIFEKEGSVSVLFRCTSADGEEGYPGNLSLTSSYILNNDNELVLEYFGECDKSSPVNITNHGYWNLAGAGEGLILDHLLKMNCPTYLPVDNGAIPLGEMASVQGTPLDFTVEKSIGKDIGKMENGYDHCFIMPELKKTEPYRFCAAIRDPESGRKMEIYTTQVGIQLYTGNFLDDFAGAEGKRFVKQSAFCLETQHLPDAVNNSDFPSCILLPGEIYKQRTIHRFSAE